MPFKSEKQRRFLWSEHPDIAKRWAHEYPNQKKLPLYAHSDNSKETESKAENTTVDKEAALNTLKMSLSRYITPVNPGNSAPITKKSNSILQYLDVPHSAKPVAAGEEHVKPKGNAQGNNGGCQARPKLSPGSLFNIKDAAIKSIVVGLGELLAKHAAVIRLGKNHQPTPDAPPTQKNVGLDLDKLRQNIEREKQQRMFSATPLPMGMQAQPAPVASYPGMNSAPQGQPQSQPQVAANKPAMQSGASNPIGLKGPLNTSGGIPTLAQNLTGNASFSNV
jgi:hypothetical protein